MRRIGNLVAAGAIFTCCFGGSARGGGVFEPERWDDTGAPAEQCVAFALYTVHDGTLKLSAQLYPLADGVDRTVSLLVRHAGEQWHEIQRVRVDETPYGWPQEDRKRWLAHFRIDNWDHSRDSEYRVLAAGGAASFNGMIRRDPVDEDEVSVAVFTGNSNQYREPRADMIRNIRAQDPDLLFFSGDQSYDHKKHYEAWLLWGRQFRDITRDRPTVCLPDDHDVGQGNVWGANGVKADDPDGDSGGFFYSPEYVNGVYAAQTWHLPDPHDPTPIERGINVCYTDLTVGGVSFAVIEDRKFKTGPRGLFEGHAGRSDHFTDPDFDPAAVDIPEARLLGDRQLAFLREWAADWTGAEMKATLSQTVFAQAAHLSGPGFWGGMKKIDLRERMGTRVVADLDSNGWPQAGRNRALVEIRRAFATMLCGDQHLATLIHHGVNEFGDAGVSFCTPSIVNYYVRRWAPLNASANPTDSSLPFTGDYLDGFGNKMTMLAYVNPDPDRVHATTADGIPWGPRAEGHGLIRFNKAERTITYEVWPRMVDVTEPGTQQYEGWPITMTQMDQYGRAARAWLPEIVVTGLDNPVMQVVDEHTGEIVYTLRVRGDRFRPHVFRPGVYGVRVMGQPGPEGYAGGLESTAEPDADAVVRVAF